MEALTASGLAEVAQESGLEVITFAATTLAIIVRNSFARKGVNFLTPDEFPQQVAYMSHPAGKQIEAHSHNKMPRVVECTQEVLFIKQGSMLVKLYTADQIFVTGRILTAGDVILLASGGHGFEVLDDVTFIEVKQGPYMGEKEKTRFACGAKASRRGAK
jgi:hypothetical protein